MNAALLNAIITTIPDIVPAASMLSTVFSEKDSELNGALSGPGFLRGHSLHSVAFPKWSELVT